MTTGLGPGMLNALAAPMTAQLELSTDGQAWSPVGDPRPCNVERIVWEIGDDLGAGPSFPLHARWVLIAPNGRRLIEPAADDYLGVMPGDTLTATRPFGLVSLAPGDRHG